jgi:molecular chaperone DnaK
LKDALAGPDVEAVKRAHEGLLSASQEFAQRLYAQAAQDQSAGAAPGGAGASAPADDEVADAEIVDDADEATGS